MPHHLYFDRVELSHTTIRRKTALDGPKLKVETLYQRWRNCDVTVEAGINNELDVLRAPLVDNPQLDAGFKIFVDATGNHESCPRSAGVEGSRIPDAFDKNLRFRPPLP